jgi:hypothetical protein
MAAGVVADDAIRPYERRDLRQPEIPSRADRVDEEKRRAVGWTFDGITDPGAARLDEAIHRSKVKGQRSKARAKV